MGLGTRGRRVVGLGYVGLGGARTWDVGRRYIRDVRTQGREVYME